MKQIFSLPSNAPRFWWKKQFGKTYYNLYNPVLSVERSRDEAKFIQRVVPLHPYHSILDLGCGHGRHAIELAKSNLHITGLDYSDYFLRIAREEAKKNQVNVKFIKKDMRHLNSVSAYDAILSMYSAFGYFPHEENMDVLFRVFRALKPGGKFLIDVINAYEHVSYIRRNGTLKKKGIYEYSNTNIIDGYTLKDKDIYYENSQLDSYHRRWTKGKKKGYFHYYMIQYTLEQYMHMLNHVGFQIQNIFGEYNESPWSKKSWRTIILCYKPSGSVLEVNAIKKYINFSLLRRWPNSFK